MGRKIIISDIDGTLIPKTERLQTKSMKKFQKLLEKNNIELGYATGRSLEEIEEGINKDGIPRPDFIIINVGTRIYFSKGGEWQIDKKWSEIISKSWKGYTHEYIADLLSPIEEPVEQERETLFDYKQSYYLELRYRHQDIISRMYKILNENDIDSKIIYSVDPVKRVGLVDVLPERGGKDLAIHYVGRKLRVSLDDIMYAGDSGNDILALVSGCNAVLVSNARKEVKRELIEIAKEKNLIEKIYFTKGNYGSGEGKYVDGVIEGAYRFKFF